MDVYDQYTETRKKRGKRGIFVLLGVILAFAVISGAIGVYAEWVQQQEIGGFGSVYLRNLTWKAVFAAGSLVVVFVAIFLTNLVIRRNVKKVILEHATEGLRLPNLPMALLMALSGAYLSKDVFYLRALEYFNSTDFGKTDPLFGKDIGYYIFQRPFLMSVTDFAIGMMIIVCLYTVIYYAIALALVLKTSDFRQMLVRSVIRHNLFNVSVFFLLKAITYKFVREGIVYDNFAYIQNAGSLTGAGFVSVNIWLKYYTVAPFLLLAIVAASFFFMWKGQLRRAAKSIAVFPAVWILTGVIAMLVSNFYVKPQEVSVEEPYIRNNMVMTRHAYGIENIDQTSSGNVANLTPSHLTRNADIVNNIRLIDYQPTLESNRQLQSNSNFYNFHGGDILPLNIDGKQVPVFVSAREIDQTKLPATKYINTTFMYTHGYGLVVNPLNKITDQGQPDYLLSGLKMDSRSKDLSVKQPRIYYGELTQTPVVVGARNIDEIDEDGNASFRYDGKGGIQLNFLNRLLFAAREGDINLLISGYIDGNSKLMINRNVVDRVQKAMPFLQIDKDPCIVPTKDGRLVWVVDAYTWSADYPYTQKIQGDANYIRNSVKVLVDAYDGKVKAYPIDKDEPLLKVYRTIYPELFSDEAFPDDIAEATRYPEYLYELQTQVLRRYHIDPKNKDGVESFYSNKDLWDIAKYPAGNNSESSTRSAGGGKVDIPAYYNMLRLPGTKDGKDELILMRPFTPSSKDNMVAWLATRNSIRDQNYGKMVLVNFPKNTNIMGPYQVENQINTNAKISQDMTLWGQGGSKVFKGSLLAVPMDDSVLYVEPIYIKSESSNSAIPQIRLVITAYQKGEDLVFGIGTNMQLSLADLFKNAGEAVKPADGSQSAGTVKNNDSATQTKPAGGISQDELKKKISDLRKQLDELEQMIEGGIR